MSESIMLINTMRIEPGELKQFEESVRKSLEFVEANGPQLMVEVYVDEGSMRAFSFQFFPDSEAMLAHWWISDPYIRDVSRHITVERLDLYGQPDEAVMEGLRPFSEEGVAVTVTPGLAGFVRFGAGEQGQEDPSWKK